VFSIANYIIDQHTKQHGLVSTAIENVTPNIFVRSGAYLNGFINLNIINKTKERAVYFYGSFAETEVSNRSVMNNSFALTGNYNDILAIETGIIFDIGFALQKDSNAQKDALYLADGPWGLDYLEDYATVRDFEITTSEIEYNDALYAVDRNVFVSGNVKGNINLFRHLLPGDQNLKMTAYNSINFSMTNNESVELIIMQEEDRAWEHRIRYVIPPNSTEQFFSIPFSDFTDNTGNSVQIKNIKTVVYSIIGDYLNSIPFEMSVKKLSFGSQDMLSAQDVNIEKNRQLLNYPNPFKYSTTIRLKAPSPHVFIQVFNVLGRTVDFQKIPTGNDFQSVYYSIPKLASGIYKYRLKDVRNKIAVGTFLIN
jgi:hypothetical protein